MMSVPHAATEAPAPQDAPLTQEDVDALIERLRRRLYAKRNELLALLGEMAASEGRPQARD